jgi:TNF receptor-associated factor 4
MEEIEKTTTIGGHECMFLEEPPSDVICPICRLVARDPQQVSCCGKIYCKSCLTELEVQSKWTMRCANCREDEPDSFPDRKTAGQINSLRVACTKRDDGCTWRGALRELKRHLSGCEYADITCPFSSFGCRVRPLRKDLQDHEDMFIRAHLDMAKNKIAKMEKIMEESKMEHESKVNETIDKLTGDFQTQKRETKKQIDKRMELQESNLRKKFNTIKSDIMSETRQLPVVLKLENFSDLQDDDEDWRSPAFYSHMGGYRMCLRVYTNGCSDVRGTHISLYVYLMKGEHDNQLEWPFRGTIHIEILNQLGDNHHYSEKITFNSKELKNYNSRVKFPNNLGLTGLGKSKFISQDELEPTTDHQYLLDDSLYFRVNRIEVHSISRPWLASAISTED